VTSTLRIQLLLALYVEMHRGPTITKTDADLIALAGDIHDGVEVFQCEAGEFQRVGGRIASIAATITV